MIEVTGDLWTYPADWRVITTNGTRKRNGACVMGRGCASEAKAKWPWLPNLLGAYIHDEGNHVYRFDDIQLLSFPVKHNWWEKADPELIKQSVAELKDMCFGQFDETEIVIPRPGCGNGGLRWEDVKPLLEILPDNIKVIHHDSNGNRA